MSGPDWNDDNCLTHLADMEQSWQVAVDKALSVRENQLTMAFKVIVSLQHQVKEQETKLRLKEEEVISLKCKLKTLNEQMGLYKEEMSNIIEAAERQLEEEDIKYKKALKSKDSELEEMRTRHKESIQQLSTGARDTLHELEFELEETKMNVTRHEKKIVQLEELINTNEKLLTDCNQVSEQLGEELSDVRQRLQNSKYTNCKLREELALWKKYLGKVEEERKALTKQVDFEKNILYKLRKVNSFLKTEKQHRNMILDVMNSFGRNIIKELKQMKGLRITSVVVTSVASQTELDVELENKKDNENNEIIAGPSQREKQLEDKLKKTIIDVENVLQQNITLREVIKGMRKEREIWEKERKQREEEAKVTKLEEIVRMIKSNLMTEQNEVSVWNTLQDVKQEVTNFKNKICANY